MKKIIILFALISVIFAFGTYLGNQSKFMETKLVENDVENFKISLHAIDKKELGSTLLIFPEQIEEKAVTSCWCIDKQGFVLYSAAIFLACKYDDSAYATEISRIKNVEVNFSDGISKKPLFASSGFSYPAYVSFFDGYDTYEYALIDNESCTIYYIFNKYNDFKDTNIPMDCWPHKYSVPSESRDNTRPGYDMYYYYDSEGIGFRSNELISRKPEEAK